MKIELTKEIAEAILRAQEDIEVSLGQGQRSNVKWTQLWVLAERVAGRTIDSSPVDEDVNWRLRLGLEPIKPRMSPEAMSEAQHPSNNPYVHPINPATTPQEMQKRMTRKPGVPDREEMYRFLKRRSMELQCHEPVPVKITPRDLLTFVEGCFGTGRLDMEQLHEIKRQFKCEGYEIDLSQATLDSQFLGGHLQWSDLRRRTMALVQPASSPIDKPAHDVLTNMFVNEIFGGE